MDVIKQSIGSIPDWPIEGVIFRDITGCLKDPKAFRATCDVFYERYKDQKIDKVVGIDARGFIFGAVLAYKLGVGFVPIRKKGKLPPETISESYSLEYGENVVEVRTDAIEEGDVILIIDDLMATGGTVAAAAALVEKLGGKVLEVAFVIELPELNGRAKLAGHKIFAITEFEGD